ncbi:MAG TPA: alpha/beta hydrolase [Solirubrobacteraceae bacterium]|nr:alpha/beta hydrolase [Solirubrobacteraceae bacterium]
MTNERTESSPPDLAGVQHEYLDAGGLRLHVALAGPANAPPVMLVHGWPQNWWEWRHLIPLLAEDHRLIVPDLRGFGWSDAPEWGYEKEQLATDLLALLDALDIERVTWIGHDWGAWIGMLAALRAPHRLTRALIMSVPHLWLPPHPRQLALLGYQGPISLPFIGPWAAERMVPRILQAGRGGDRLPVADVELFAANIPPRVTVAMYRTFLTREVLPIARGRYETAQLQVPTTVMYGDQDLVTRGLRAGPDPGQPQLRVEAVPGVAHWIPEQRPRVVLDWLSQN